MSPAVQHIVHHRPKEYPCQKRIAGCGMYSIKAVIEAKYPHLDNHFKSYTQNRRNKTSGFMFPWQITQILSNHGLKTEICSGVGKKKEKKLQLLKENLQKGPLILLIAHAYNKKKNFSIRRAIMFQHYITIRGYDDEQEHFFVYDSNPPKNKVNENLPVGNMTLAYKHILKYRKLSFFGLYPNFAISVKYITEEHSS